MSVSEMEKLNQALSFIREQTDFVPDVVIILGSGLGGLEDRIEPCKKIDCEDVPYLVKSTTAFHKGRMVFGYLNGVKVLAFSGRVHLYEGYSVEEVVRPVRLGYLLGAKKIVLTNAAGGINAQYRVGDLVILKDHISSFVPSPITGQIRRDIGGVDFPDMTQVYDREHADILENICKMEGVSCKRGVYLQVKGAQYETPAEINFYRMIGADLVGMSTVVEAITARHLGMRILGVSLVTNMAAGLSEGELSHEEVKKTADSASADFCKVIYEFISKIN